MRTTNAAPMPAATPPQTVATFCARAGLYLFVAAAGHAALPNEESQAVAGLSLLASVVAFAAHLLIGIPAAVSPKLADQGTRR